MKKVSLLESFGTDVLLCGEQLRHHLHQRNVIRDREHRGKLYKKCFVACELVDELISTGDLPGRGLTCLMPMQILLEHGIIHGIEEEMEFKDEYALYSFRIDDDTFIWTEEAQIVLSSAALYFRLESSKMLKDHTLANNIYPDSILGSTFTEWLVKNDPRTSERSDAVKYGQRLLDWDIIANVLNQYPLVFTDDCKALYHFRLDVRRKRSPSGLLIYMRGKRSANSASTDSLGSQTAAAGARSIPPISFSQTNRKVSTGSAASLNDSSVLSTSPSVTTESELSSCTDSDVISCMPSGNFLPSGYRIPSVMLRHVTVEELEDDESPFVKMRVVMRRDDVGYGFVLRGSCPCYVQVIDPNSPAAKSGLQIRQYVGSVNGLNVLRMDSKELSSIIAGTDWLHLIVYTQSRRSVSLDDSLNNSISN